MDILFSSVIYVFFGKVFVGIYAYLMVKYYSPVMVILE